MKKSLRKTKPIKAVSQTVAIQTLTLVTSAFSLTAALAWNEAIKEYVTVYVKPYFAQGSGVLSLFLYALGITTLTVIITLQLSRLTQKVSKG